MEEENEVNEENVKSKSEKKREVTALQKLGEKLINLSKEQIKNIEMDEELSEAILFGKTIKKKEAFRRHKQFIGSIMRSVDIEPVKKALEQIEFGIQVKNEDFKKTESYRDRLIEGDSKVLEEILTEYPDGDRQHIRQLIRNAINEKKKNKPPKTSRVLFRYLKELITDKKEQQ